MKKLVRALAFALSLLLVALVFSGAIMSCSAVSYSVGDVIKFGSYPQSEVTDSALTSKLNTLKPDANGDVSYDGSRYRRTYFKTEINRYQSDNGYDAGTVYWFKYEPVEWVILSVSASELKVMSRYILDVLPYNDKYVAVTWEKSTLRSVLNSEFMNTLFTAEQQKYLVESKNVNKNNFRYNTAGGNDTADKVYVLSWDEVLNASYGFSATYNEQDVYRRASGSDYSKSKGLKVDTLPKNANGKSAWWLRSPGYEANSACYVHATGLADFMYFVNNNFVGVRASVNLKLSSGASVAQSAEEVSSKAAEENSASVTKKANGKEDKNDGSTGKTVVGDGIALSSDKSVLNVGDKTKLDAVITDKGGSTTAKPDDGTTTSSTKPDDGRTVAGETSPDGTTEKSESGKIVWKSSDDKVAAVDKDGNVSAKSKGNVTIYAYTEDGKSSAEYGITVKEATTVVIDRPAVEIEYTDTDSLIAAAENGEKLTWSSSDESVVTVDENGNLYAAGRGTATVTATAESGVSAVCEVTVVYAWWQWLIIIFLFGWIWYI